MLDKVLYHKAINAVGEPYAAVSVTEETNGYAVWVSTEEEGSRLLGFDRYNKSAAIELGVDYARRPLCELLTAAL